MRTRIKPHIPPLLILTLARALLTARMAKVVVAVVLLLFAALAWCLGEDPGLTFGRVKVLVSKPQMETHFAILSNLVGDIALRLPDTLPEMPQAGDLVLVDGEALHVPQAGGFLDVQQLTILPLRPIVEAVARTWAERSFDRVSPVVSTLAALLIVAFGAPVLRLAPSLLVGLVSVTAAAMVWQVKQAEKILPVPHSFLNDILLAAAIIGAVAAWKAMGRKPHPVVQRIGALALTMWLMPFLTRLAAPGYEVLAFYALPSVLTAPTQVLVAAALPVLALGWNPGPLGYAFAAISFGIIRLGLDLLPEVIRRSSKSTTDISKEP